MVHKELFQSFTDRVIKCNTDIRVIDGSANPTDEATMIRPKHGIKKATPGLFLVLSNMDNMSLEKLNEKINAYNGESEIPASVIDDSPTVNFAATRGNHNADREGQPSRKHTKSFSEHKNHWKVKGRDK